MGEGEGKGVAISNENYFSSFVPKHYIYDGYLGECRVL